MVRQRIVAILPGQQLAPSYEQLEVFADEVRARGIGAVVPRIAKGLSSFPFGESVGPNFWEFPNGCIATSDKSALYPQMRGVCAAIFVNTGIETRPSWRARISNSVGHVMISVAQGFQRAELPMALWAQPLWNGKDNDLRQFSRTMDDLARLNMTVLGGDFDAIAPFLDVRVRPGFELHNDREPYYGYDPDGRVKFVVHAEEPQPAIEA